MFNALTPTLRVTDLETSLVLYRDLLGFDVDTLWPPERPTLAILDHGPGVHLMLDADYPGDPGPAFSGALRFDVDRCSDVLLRLGDRFAPEWGPEDYHYGRREFAIRDPDGYLLIFSERI